ncbi:MAG: DNA polymerase I [Propionibacteriaceae bacterium]|nr:DNA polymerase I [Propionibacteriaceae bacterium]
MLLDGHSVAFRAFYALPAENFTTSTGQATNAVYGFTAMLIGLLRDEKPTHVAVAFDVSRTTFRTDEYAAYKATRSETPPAFIGQTDLIKEVLAALRITWVEADRYEADDVIATLSAQAEAAGLDVLICSGDRDTFQLVSDAVTVLYPRRGASDLARMTPAAVEEKYGVPPDRYPDLAALVGEQSDNLPGVPGVGPKTAAKWVREYGGLAGLLERIEEAPGKAGQSLRERREDVERNRRLNRLVRDLALPVGPADLVRQPWDREAVGRVFEALEFRTLRDRLSEIGPPAAAPDPAGGFAIAAEALAPGLVRDWLDSHTAAAAGEAPLTGLDLAGCWAADGGDVSRIALAAADGAAAWFDAAALTPDDEAALGAWLADPSRPKAGHACKGPLRALWARGWDLRGLQSDTELAAYLVRPDQRGYGLEDLVSRYLGRSLAAAGDNQGDAVQPALDLTGADSDDGAAAALRAAAVRELAGALDTELAERAAALLLRDVELPLERILAQAELAGVAADGDLFERLRADFDSQVQAAEQAAYDVIGRTVNLSSPKQLQVVLFDELEMPKTRRVKSGHTTDADALADLYAKTGHPFLAHLLAHRDALRLRQTAEGLAKAIADDGRIHTTYLQTAAATGRLSSIEPNLQNIPIRTAAGRQLREGFVAGPGFEALLTADYSQIEMRIMAHLSGDQALIGAFRSGRDFHAVMAGHVFGVAPADVTADQRARVKAMNYGLAYGLSAYGLSGQLKVSVGEAQRLMDDYFEVFGPVRDYLGTLVAEARRTGYTETLLGRRRYLPDLTSANRTRREMAERMALNAPIQGSAADLVKLAMIRADEALRRAKLRSRLLLQVHDELIFEVAQGEAAAVEELAREAMGAAAPLSVPLDVSVGLGPTWAAAAH